ncbi:hypothetical protein [uncultured Paraglaciecola sp.]|uniref:hypothetical protein n=1 Tax=uncultured Paraglaciecola sp. TaxID=1765024 RepID=UPI00261A92D7|nr:hypothetical protein [uncultured Paraglaciecola sp.]
MNIYKKLSTLLIALFAVVGLSACGDDKAEDAGEKIDEVATDVGNAIEDACEDVKEGMKAEDKDC